MTDLARRLFAWCAVLVFALAATFAIIYAGAWRWAGWRQGFVRDGAIAITSQPRAVLFVNGQALGRTPQRLTHVRPGVVDLELRQDLMMTWHHQLRIEPGQARVIGPVKLFPATPTVKPLAVATGSSVLADQNRNVLFELRPQTDGVELRSLWPNQQDFGLIPFQPNQIALSPHRLVVVASDAESSALRSTDEAATTKILPHLDNIFWLPETDNVVYGLVSNQLMAYDLTTQSERRLGTADAAGPFGSDVWIATRSNEKTVISRVSPLSANGSTSLMECPGLCDVQSGPGARLIVHQANGLTQLLSLRVTGDPLIREIGRSDQVFWPNANQPPLWIRGVEIWTFDENQQPALLDRHSQPIQSVTWVDPPHVLLVEDQAGLSIMSVTARQGRGVAFSAPLNHDQQSLVLDVGRRTVVVSGMSGVETWTWSSDRPDRASRSD